MKIRHKLTFVSTALFGLVFLIIAVIIYWAFDRSSKNIFYGELARTAKVAAMFYLEEDELTKVQFQPIADAFYNLSPEQKVSIYDEQDSTAFDTEKYKSETMIPKLDEVRRKGSLNFKKGHHYYHALFYRDNQGDFVVLVKAESPLIQDQLQNLILILTLSFILGMTLLLMLTSWLSRLAYEPVRYTIRQVNTLDLNQKPLRLEYNSTKDELEELFEAFNVLLREIEQTYEQQKNFVDYASHEFKTPLAGIISQLEVLLQRERNTEDYKETSQVVLYEAERLRDILKNLLTFSSLNRVAHQRNYFRVDEMIWEVLDQLSKKYPMERFAVDLNISAEDYKILEFEGNQTLLSVAFYNLIENAAKFSENEVSISLFTKNKQLFIQIEDQGIGISPKDLKNIANPFYRAQNASLFPGSGLGVSIALKILELHKIDFHIQSEENKGTSIELGF